MRTKEARRPAAGMHLAPGAHHGQLACASALSVEDNGLSPRHRFFCLGLRSAGHPAGRASWLPFVPFSAIPWAFPPFMDRPAKATLPVLNEIKGYARYIAYAESTRANALDSRSQGRASLLRSTPAPSPWDLKRPGAPGLQAFASGASMKGGRWSAVACNRHLRRAGQSLHQRLGLS